MSFEPSSLAVTRNHALRRFEMRVDGEVATLSYTQGKDSVSFDHTDVPEALRGKGVATALVRAALQEARRQHWTVVPRCPVVAGFIMRNPDFADLVRPERR